MTIDEFDVSEECRNELKNVGFTFVEEIVEILNNNAEIGAPIARVWGEHLKETIAQLELMGLWTEPENFWHTR